VASHRRLPLCSESIAARAGRLRSAASTRSAGLAGTGPQSWPTCVRNSTLVKQRQLPRCRTPTSHRRLRARASAWNGAGEHGSQHSARAACDVTRCETRDQRGEPIARSRSSLSRGVAHHRRMRNTEAALGVGDRRARTGRMQETQVTATGCAGWGHTTRRGECIRAVVRRCGYAAPEDPT